MYEVQGPQKTKDRPDLYRQSYPSPNLRSGTQATVGGVGGMSPADTADHMMRLHTPSAAAVTSFT
eukprot:scaffold48730_cov32-Attheya_sp.AAC.1